MEGISQAYDWFAYLHTIQRSEGYNLPASDLVLLRSDDAREPRITFGLQRRRTGTDRLRISAEPTDITVL
jgi:hypothetical protein